MPIKIICSRHLLEQAMVVLGIQHEQEPVFGARAAQPISDHYRPDNQRKSGRPAVISVGQAYLLIERRLY
ncbi:hypothetical protein [Anderseniella sp. Alg231-50]|uniref:hypothetical protein n=1 Tax=Anderseniella sp. Alg231-50 TaxID=1922226 RepID=UPI000D552134